MLFNKLWPNSFFPQVGKVQPIHSNSVPENMVSEANFFHQHDTGHNLKILLGLSLPEDKFSILEAEIHLESWWE